jgi:hypothetical protein
MADLRSQLLAASKLHFEGHLEKHRVNIELLLQNGVGVAEHPDVMETIEGELAHMAEYHDKLEMLQKYF